MAKFYLNQLPEKERTKLIGKFYDAINCLKTREEVRSFFRDLLSPDEIAMLVRRIEVARFLRKGITYEEIRAKLGVGKDKVTNVQKSLSRHGEGYNLMIERLEKNNLFK